MKKMLVLVLLCFGLYGCASLNSSVPFRYQPSLIASNKTIDKVVGLNLLSDKRPEIDVSYTKSIKDISEKVTAKLLEDFDKSKLFKEIHFPARTTDDIVISGTIDNFIWKMYATPINYIPVLGLVVIFGVPEYEAYGIAGITLEIKDNKSGTIIGKLEETSRQESEYTMYNFKTGEAGAELEEAFRDVAKKLKEGVSNT